MFVCVPKKKMLQVPICFYKKDAYVPVGTPEILARQVYRQFI
jgi:hypothetical protein